MKPSALLLFLTFLIQLPHAREAHVKDALIVYGTWKGSTREIAERVRDTLVTNGHRVDLLPVGNGKMDLTPYRLVVLGSAIHGAAPHPDVLAFVDANREGLRTRKTAVFIVCITITSSKPEKREAARRYPEKVALGFTPVSTTVFAGVAADGGWFGNLMGRWMLGIKPGDYRDWKAITEWATALSRELN